MGIDYTAEIIVGWKIPDDFVELLNEEDLDELCEIGFIDGWDSSRRHYFGIKIASVTNCVSKNLGSCNEVTQQLLESIKKLIADDPESKLAKKIRKFFEEERPSVWLIMSQW